MDFAKLIHWLKVKQCFKDEVNKDLEPKGGNHKSTVISPNSMVLILKDTFNIDTKKGSISDTTKKPTFFTETELNALTDETIKHQ
jgi:hypothetical protein